MIRLRTHFPLVSLFALAVLGACTTMEAGPPPLLDLGARECSASVDLARAVPVPFDPKGTAEPALVPLDAASPCVARPGAKPSVYAVFALPAGDVPYFLSIASLPVGGALFPPSAELLDASGSVLRAVDSKAFLFRGNALTAQIRSHEGERYLLVQSVSELVGTTVSRTGVATSGSTVSTGNGGFVSMYSGSDVTTTLTFSLNGRLAVSATRAKLD